jgi:soluble lytic murein transglycosylase-like protein
MRPLVCSALLLSALLAQGARAEGIYTYRQKDGTIVYTNVAPHGVKAKKVKGTFHPAPSPDAKVDAAPRAAASYESIIDDACRRYNIPKALVKAVMTAESGLDPKAVSPKGAVGLMQLMPTTAEKMYVRDLFEPKQNIEGGTRYLRVLANRFNGDMVKMIAAYNAGPDVLKKYGGDIPPYAETQAYVKRVLQLYYQYKSMAQKVAEGDAVHAADQD